VREVSVRLRNLLPIAPDAAASSVLELRPHPRTLAPDWRSRLRNAPLSAGVAAAVLLIVGAVRDPTLSGWLWSFGAVLLIVAVPNLLARANAIVRITPECVVYRGMFRVRRRCPRNTLAAMVQVHLAVLGSRYPLTRLLLVDTSGRARISVQAEWFSLSDLDTLEATLGVPVSEIDGPIAPRALNRRYPGASSFVLVHRFAVTAVVVLLALTIAGFILQAAHG
jgi:hypothetical protein